MTTFTLVTNEYDLKAITTYRFLEGCKLLFWFYPILLSQVIAAQEIADTEKEGNSILIGLAPTLALKESLYGVNGRFYYGVNDAFCFGPEVSYFPYQDRGPTFEKMIIDLNINAHYIFELSEKIGLYPLSGINYTIEKERVLAATNEGEKEEAFGINYGLGVHYRFNTFFIFSEFKGILGHLNAEFISAGVIFDIKIRSKKSK